MPYKRLKKRWRGRPKGSVFWKKVNAPFNKPSLFVRQTPHISKVFYCAVEGFHVFLVDAEYVRNNLDIDFNLGTHHGVNKFVPEGEVWIDSRISPSEIEAIITHEVKEAKLMEEGMEYEEAHEIATRKEKEVRGS